MVDFVRTYAFELFFGGFASMVLCCYLMMERNWLRAGRRIRDKDDSLRATIRQARDEHAELTAAFVASLHDAPRVQQNRAGISLTEVLIAMGIMTIAILGIASLAVVGSADLRTAQTLDRSSNLGRAAFHDVQVRGYLDPKMWLTVFGTGSDYTNSTPAWTHPRLPVDMMSPVERCTPFCIDPLMIAAHAGNNAKLTQLAAFPVELDNDPPNGLGLQIPRMARGTLRAWKDDTPTAAVPPQLTMGSAERIFRSSDDLMFGLPDGEPDARPRASLGSANQVRQFTGDYSYMITVVPHPTDFAATTYVDGTTNVLPPAVGEQSYTVSVVVFQKRVLDVPALDAADRGDLPPTERLVYLDFITGVTAGGGDVRLHLPGGTMQDLAAVKPGRWIMLAGAGWNFAKPPPPQQPALTDEEMPARYGWYRITSCGEPRIEGGEVVQDVRLFGADWTPGDAVDASSGVPMFYVTNPDADGDKTDMTIHAIIPDGVVNVYEKTMRLDSRSFGVR